MLCLRCVIYYLIVKWPSPWAAVRWRPDRCLSRCPSEFQRRLSAAESVSECSPDLCLSEIAAGSEWAAVAAEATTTTSNNSTAAAAAAAARLSDANAVDFAADDVDSLAASID